MIKYFKTFFLILAFPLLTLLTGCNSEDAFSVPSSAKLERIDIVASPITTRGVSELTLAKGNNQPFEAVGHYSDGTSQVFTDLSVLDWHSSDLEVASFNEPGVLTSVDEGSTTVTASKDGITSNEVAVTVSDAVITAIQVTPSPVKYSERSDSAVNRNSDVQ